MEREGGSGWGGEAGGKEREGEGDTGGEERGGEGRRR